MTEHRPTTLHENLRTEVDGLRRSLRRVIMDAQRALDHMDEGQRPSPYMRGTVFGSVAVDAEAHAVRIDLMLNFTGSELLDAASAVAILRGGEGL